MPFFRFTVGNAVQLTSHAPIQQVTWRGKQWVPGPDGKPYQVLVYRLDNSYYEHELFSALRWGSA